MIIAKIDGELSYTAQCKTFEVRKPFEDDGGELIAETARYRIHETDKGLKIIAVNGDLSIKPSATNSILVDIITD